MLALVTGASSGIGLMYARELARQGHDLILVSNQEKELEETRESIEKEFGVKAEAVFKDLTSPTAAEELMAYCKEKGHEVQIVINNAGVFFFNYLINTPIRRIELMLNLHVMNTTRMVRLFGEEMASRNRDAEGKPLPKEQWTKGYILNMSSLSCWTAMPGIQCYNATKAYINNFSLSMWYELRPYGVTVTSVTPGAVDTGLYGLSMSLRKLAVALRVSIRPEDLVKKALRAMFRGKKKSMPGLINHLYLPFVKHTPDWLVRLLFRHIDQFMK